MSLELFIHTLRVDPSDCRLGAYDQVEVTRQFGEVRGDDVPQHAHCARADHRIPDRLGDDETHPRDGRTICGAGNVCCVNHQELTPTSSGTSSSKDRPELLRAAQSTSGR